MGGLPEARPLEGQLVQTVIRSGVVLQRLPILHAVHASLPHLRSAPRDNAHVMPAFRIAARLARVPSPPPCVQGGARTHRWRGRLLLCVHGLVIVFRCLLALNQ